MPVELLDELSRCLEGHGVSKTHFAAMVRSVGRTDCELHDRANNIVVSVAWPNETSVLQVRQIAPTGKGVDGLQRDLDAILELWSDRGRGGDR